MLLLNRFIYLSVMLVFLFQTNIGIGAQAKPESPSTKPTTFRTPDRLTILPDQGAFLPESATFIPGAKLRDNPKNICETCQCCMESTISYDAFTKAHGDRKITVTKPNQAIEIQNEGMGLPIEKLFIPGLGFDDTLHRSYIANKSSNSPIREWKGRKRIIDIDLKQMRDNVDLKK
jgi:hypothetical protein